MIKREDKNQSRQVRHIRVRNKISGTAERPRLNVYRSNKHIVAQIIDDSTSITLVSVNTTQKEIVSEVEGKTKNEQAFVIGQIIGKKAVEKGIKKVVFDRGGYIFTGRVKALADGARNAGLEF